MNLHVAYICGILSTRGSVSFNKVKGNYRYYLETKDPRLAKRFAKTLFLAFSERPRIINRNGSRCVVLYGKKHVETILNYISIDEHIPKSQEEPFVRNFLQGIFDFNSSVRLKDRVHKNGRIQSIPQIRVNSKRLKVLEFVKNELKKRGINSSIYRSGETFTLEISGKSNVLMFIKKIGGKNKEKIGKLKSFLGWYEKSRSPIVEVKE